MNKPKNFKDEEDQLLDDLHTMYENWDTGCASCKHLFRDLPVKNKCKAFPGGIPEPYLNHEEVHTERKYGQDKDNNYTFKSIYK